MLCTAMTFFAALAITAQQTNPNKIITFSAPWLGKTAGQGTLAIGIIASNAMTEYDIDGRGVYHGFVQTRKSESFAAEGHFSRSVRKLMLFRLPHPHGSDLPPRFRQRLIVEGCV
jgi:hypothetical protein